MASIFSRTAARSSSNSSFFSRQGQNTSLDFDAVQRQIDNASLRIQDAGYPVEEAQRRNVVERALNLPSGQNALFDVLEVLQRPFQGIANVIDKSLFDGTQSVGQALGRGLSGKDRVRGSELAGKAGIENKAGRAIAGTALEIGLDPVSYVPGGVILKGAKLATKPLASAAKGSLNLLENYSPTFKRALDETIRPAASSTKDRLGYMFNPDYRATDTLTGGQSDFLTKTYRDTENTRRFAQEEYTNRLLGTAQKTGLEAGEQVGRIMEAPLKQFEDVKAYEFPDGVRRTRDKGDILSEISSRREDIRNVSKDIRSTQKGYDAAIGDFAKQIDKTDQEIRRLFTSLERQADKEIAKETRQQIRELGREVARIESQLNNFGANEKSLLRHYKKLISEQHEGRFDLYKQIKKHAPNGIKISGISKADLPQRLKPLVKENGLDIEILSNELGYVDYRDLLADMSVLDGVPRKLTKSELDSLARKEAERTGALRDLSETREGLEIARETMQQSLREIVPESAEGRAFIALENNPRYQELIAQRESLKSTKDSLFGESRSASVERIAKIRQIEDEINALQESARNPVMLQREIDRPVRELSDNPEIRQAAETLLKSNNELRMWAEQEGIAINELEGYMTHILSAEERKARKAARAKNIDRSLTGMNQPDKKILQQRKLTGSVEDINERLDKKLFEPNAYFASAIGQRRLIDYISSVSFRRKVLNNPDFAKPYEKGMEIPANAAVIDTNNYKFIKPDGDLMEDVAMKDIGGQYVVTKAVKEKLDRYKSAMTDEGTKAFLNAYDAAQSAWKRMALFSLPYHVRNDVGAKFNAWIAGMRGRDIAKYGVSADKEVFNAMIRGKETPLYREYRKQGLGATSQSQIEFARGGQDPEAAIEKLVREGSKDIKGKVKDRLNPLRAFETSREFGDFVDQTNRYMIFKWAVDKGKSYDEAARLVKESQFDYTNLTNFERNVMARAVPFYRWARNNIPFQVRQFINDPRKYAAVNKLRLNAQDAAGIDEESVPDWMKENFAFPVYAKGGKGQMLGFNIPAGDLARLSDPGKMLIDSMTPLAKLPMELSLNRSFFYNKPIEQFEGQEKQFSIFGRKFSLPSKTAYALEQGTGQIGRGVSGLLQPDSDKDQDTMFRLPKLGISGILKDFDIDKANYYELRNYLRQLQDYMNYIEQQDGARPRSVNEINKGGR